MVHLVVARAVGVAMGVERRRAAKVSPLSLAVGVRGRGRGRVRVVSRGVEWSLPEREEGLGGGVPRGAPSSAIGSEEGDTAVARTEVEAKTLECDRRSVARRAPRREWGSSAMRECRGESLRVARLARRVSPGGWRVWRPPRSW